MAFKACFVEIKSSGVDGRGLFATRDIKPGDTVFIKKRPLTATPSCLLWETMCANCFNGLDTPTPNFDDSGNFLPEVQTPKLRRCTQCKEVVYCGQKCQVEHWKRSHKAMCKQFYVKFFSTKFTDSMVKARFPCILPSMIEILAMRDRGVLTDQEWNSILELKSHEKEMAISTPERYSKSEELPPIAAHTVNFSKYISLAPKLMCILMTNSFELVSPMCEPRGFCFDPFTSIANHSCDPNTFTVMDGAEISFRALKEIKMGEEIFVSYVKPEDSRKRRRADLKERYYFDCNCSKCASDPEGLRDRYPDLNPSIMKHAMRKMNSWLEIGDAKLQVKRPSSWTPSTMQQTLQALDEYHLDYIAATTQQHDNTQDTLIVLEQILQRCKELGFYAPAHQPVPETNHELVLAYMKQGNWTSAFERALRAYLEIDPMVYPQRFHPLRVMSMWRLYRIIMMLLSEGQGNLEYQAYLDKLGEHGIDLFYVMKKVLREAAEASQKSHGLDSAVRRVFQLEYLGFIKDDAERTKGQPKFSSAQVTEMNQQNDEQIVILAREYGI